MQPGSENSCAGHEEKREGDSEEMKISQEAEVANQQAFSAFSDLVMASKRSQAEEVKEVGTRKSARGRRKSVASEKDAGAVNPGRWSHEEHKRFLEALELHGKNWKLVEKFVGTRTSTQVRSHAQKYFNKIAKGQSASNVDNYSSYSAINASRKNSSWAPSASPFKEAVSHEDASDVSIGSARGHRPPGVSHFAPSETEHELASCRQLLGNIQASLSSFSPPFAGKDEALEKLRAIRADLHTLAQHLVDLNPKIRSAKELEDVWSGVTSEMMEALRKTEGLQQELEESLRVEFDKGFTYFKEHMQKVYGPGAAPDLGLSYLTLSDLVEHSSIPSTGEERAAEEKPGGFVCNEQYLGGVHSFRQRLNSEDKK